MKKEDFINILYDYFIENISNDKKSKILLKEYYQKSEKFSKNLSETMLKQYIDVQDKCIEYYVQHEIELAEFIINFYKNILH